MAQGVQNADSFALSFYAEEGPSWSARVLFQQDGCPYSISEQQAAHFLNSSEPGNAISVERFGAGTEFCRIFGCRTTSVWGLAGIAWHWEKERCWREKHDRWSNKRLARHNHAFLCFFCRANREPLREFVNSALHGILLQVSNGERCRGDGRSRLQVFLARRLRCEGAVK